MISVRKLCRPGPPQTDCRHSSPSKTTAITGLAGDGRNEITFTLLDDEGTEGRFMRMTLSNDHGKELSRVDFRGAGEPDDEIRPTLARALVQAMSDVSQGLFH